MATFAVFITVNVGKENWQWLGWLASGLVALCVILVFICLFLREDNKAAWKTARREREERLRLLRLYNHDVGLFDLGTDAEIGTTFRPIEERDHG